MPALRYWLLATSALAFLNTYMCYCTSLAAQKQMYPFTTEITPLAGRFDGSWTAVSGVVRLVAAFNTNNRAVLLATWGGFMVADLHFLLEIGVFGTTDVKRAAMGLGIDVFSVVWIGLKLLSG